MSQRHAFTLIELLVVISIISLLVAILLPALSTARAAAQAAGCLSNLRQIAIGTAGYQNDFSDYFPPYRNLPGELDDWPNPVTDSSPAWNHRLAGQGYLGGDPNFYTRAQNGMFPFGFSTVVFCPSQTDRRHQTTAWTADQSDHVWGMPSYGMSTALYFDYNVAVGSSYQHRYARSQDVRRESIQLVDSYSIPLLNSRNIIVGRREVVPYSTTSAGQPYGRHNGAAGVLWNDGHATQERSSDPSDHTAWYGPNGVFKSFNNPGNKWLPH